MRVPFLLFKSGSYFARLKFTAAHRAIAPSLELRWSLRTNHRKLAERRLPYAQVAFQRITKTIEAAVFAVKFRDLDSVEMMALRHRIKAYIQEELDEFRAAMAEHDDLPPHLYTRMHARKELMPIIRQSLDSLNFSDGHVVAMASEYLDIAPDLASHFDEPNPGYRTIAREACQAQLDVHGAELAMFTESRRQPTTPPASGFSVKELKELLSVVVTQELAKQTSADSVPQKTQAMKLSALIEQYKREISLKRKYAAKTLDSYQSQWSCMLAYFGDCEITNITRESALGYVEILNTLPPKFELQLRGGEVLQKIAEENAGKKTIGKNTVVKYVATASTVLNHAVQHGLGISVNPFKGLASREGNAEDSDKRKYTTEQLKLLFGGAQYKGVEWFANPLQYWLPLIGLYSGMRISEICQLHKSDIKRDGEIYYFDLCKGSEKTFKTKSSIRQVPIHGKLIELGFLHYVKEMQRLPGERLFEGFAFSTKNGAGHYGTKWFATFSNNQGVVDSNVDFHSFRHTFTDAAKQADAEEEKLREVVGHANESITTRLYAKRYSPQILASVVNKVQFPIEVVSYRQAKIKKKP